MHASLSRASETRDLSSEQEIAGILVGGHARPRDPSSFASAAIRHAVAPLLVKAGVADLLPAECAARLVAEARNQAAITELRERELRGVLDALHGGGIPVLLIKGAHLASSCYPESYLRTRDDTDLFVRASDRGRVTATLNGLGYRPQPVQTGAAVLGQTLFDRHGTVAAALDVHWRIAQPILAASLFDFDDLLSRSVVLPRLSPLARGPAPADALALACVHQAAHHQGHDLLLWTYDVHLLLSGWVRQDVEHFVALATTRRIAAVCVSGIAPAEALFGTAIATELLARLRAAAGGEPSAAWLRPRGRLRRIVLDLRALTSWPARAQLVAGHLFPPAAYMRATYAPSSHAPMAWLYLRRLLRARS